MARAVYYGEVKIEISGLTLVLYNNSSDYSILLVMMLDWFLDPIERAILFQSFDQMAIDYGYYLSPVQAWIIKSCLMRGDIKTAKQHILDWASIHGDRKANVSKWVPGTHYYALDEKFDAIDDAIQHLKDNGYKYAGLSEVFVEWANN